MTLTEPVRPPVERRGTRVIVVDESGAVLLLSADETLFDGSLRVIWFTPGGEVEGAETLPEAAVRELHEETGLALAPERLSAPVAMRSGLWSVRGVDYAVQETYFFVRLPRWIVAPAAFTPLEQELLTGHRWWTIDDLVHTTETVFPPGLAPLIVRLLAGDLPDPPLSLLDVDPTP